MKLPKPSKPLTVISQLNKRLNEIHYPFSPWATSCGQKMCAGSHVLYVDHRNKIVASLPKSETTDLLFAHHA